MGYLEELYGYPHRESTAEREFDDLTMSGSDKFECFITSLHVLLNILEYNEHVISVL